MAKKTKKTTSYDLEKEVMLALVIRRPLRNRLERIIPEGETMRSFVTALIEKAVNEAANSQAIVHQGAEKLAREQGEKVKPATEPPGPKKDEVIDQLLERVPAASPAPELKEGYLPPLTAAKE